MLRWSRAVIFASVIGFVWLFGSINAQCTQNLLPFTELCSGHGSCDNDTRCICDEGFTGRALFFDLGDTDCPISVPGFSAIAYIQFGLSILTFIGAFVRMVQFRFWIKPERKRQIRAVRQLIALAVGSSVFCVYVALYIFGGLYIYNSVASLVISILMWMAFGFDIYLRQANIYGLFKSSTVRLKRAYKKVKYLPFLTPGFFAAVQISFDIAIHTVDSSEIRIQIVRGRAVSTIVAFIVMGISPLLQSIKIRRRLENHLKNAAIEDKRLVKLGVRKMRILVMVLSLAVIVFPMIPMTIIIAMPIFHVYTWQIMMTLYIFSGLQLAFLILTPARTMKQTTTSDASKGSGGGTASNNPVP
jgi:hypothetical protein